MAKKKLTKAERAERDARHERVLANAQRTRELAERRPSSTRRAPANSPSGLKWSGANVGPS